MSMEKKFCWHWFHSLTGIGQKEKEELLALCPDVRQWYFAGQKKETEAFFDAETLTEGQKQRKAAIRRILEDSTQAESAQKSFDELEKKEIFLVAREEENFPLRLKNVYLPPFVLYYKGKLPKEEKTSVGIVGARNCSVYGEEIAAEFGRALSDAGVQIISGMARGIDGSAQRSAAGRAGGAYAVLGSGVDVCYPKENKTLYLDLCRSGGVISEEIPGTAPMHYNFPRRNRIIAGLSDALLVVEAREKSGSLITVSYALEQGKEVYAVPGRLYDRLAEGTNQLIQDGAYLVRRPEDILQNFQSERDFSYEKTQKIQKLTLETNEKMVYACLSLQPKHMEQIAGETGIGLSELSALLFEMEMKHYIKQPIRNYYIIQSSM